MKDTQVALATLAFAIPSVLAACNCKCQDPSGTGPQWNWFTSDACAQEVDGENVFCLANRKYHAEQHHRCSSSLCCIDGSAFYNFFKMRGAPGAYCW